GGVGVARPSRRGGGAGWGAGASVATLAQDRVHQLAADPAADPGVRDRGVDVQQGGPGLPGRGPEAAAAARLGGPGLRPAGDRVVARRQATEAEGPATAAAEVRAAIQRSPEPRATTRAGAAAAYPVSRQRRDSGTPGRGELRVDLRRRRSRLEHRRRRSRPRHYQQGARAAEAVSVALPPVNARLSAAEIAALTQGQPVGAADVSGTGV